MIISDEDIKFNLRINKNSNVQTRTNNGNTIAFDSTGDIATFHLIDHIVWTLSDGKLDAKNIALNYAHSTCQNLREIEHQVFSSVDRLLRHSVIEIIDSPSMIFYDVSKSGLCNRLRGLFSCMVFANILKIPIGFRWKPDLACEVEFSTLFEELPNIKIINSEDELDQAIVWRVTERRTLYDFCKNYPFLTTNYTLQKLRTDYNKHAKTLLPRKSILDRVDEFAIKHGFSENTAGIHIRRTDHEICNKIPDEWYRDKINSLIEEDPSRTIFLATDNLETEEAFSNIAQVTSYNKRWLYNSSDKKNNIRIRDSSIRDAVIDLYLLARCKVIYASPSSFSAMSSTLGNTKIVRASPSDTV